MDWFNSVIKGGGWKLVRSFPKANLISCLSNLARRGFIPREIIDVGAHKAKWSRAAQRVFSTAGYTLIEPLKELEPYLARFCNGNTNRRYISAGAGSQPGELELTAYPDKSASSFVVHAPAKRRLGVQRMVPVVTLDKITAEYIGRPPDLVKIDAEGFEQEVILGAKSLIGHTEVIFLEAHFLGAVENPSSFTSIVRFMDELDYVPYDFTWFGKRKFDGALMMCEIAFVRRHGLLRSLTELSPTIQQVLARNAA